MAFTKDLSMTGEALGGVVMKMILALMVLVQLVWGCSNLRERADDPDFSKTTAQFLEKYWEAHPRHASEAGLHQYDSVLEIPNQKNREHKLTFYKQQLQIFENVDPDPLSISQRTDLALICNQLQKRIWQIETFRSHQWKLDDYNLAEEVSVLLNRHKRPLANRLKDLSEKLKNSPEYFQEIKNNISRPTREQVNLAIKQSRGALSFIRGHLRTEIKKSSIKGEELKKLNQRVAATEQATRRYITYLKGLLTSPKAVGGFRDFRIKPELYAQKFEYDLQIDSTPKELYKKALVAKEETRSKMFEAAIELYPKYFGSKLPPKDRQEVIEDVLKKVSIEHPKADNFVDTVRKQIPELTAFIKEKDLLTLDESRPLIIRETPVYQRGFAGASVDSPGLFDPQGDTFYNVTPLDDMSGKQQESYLREYNNYTLQILNIHEALPGHYVQMIYRNKSKSVVKSIFGNNPMTEGWAVYTERMMLEEGYGNNSMELWLMYYKWFLRVVTNTILDYEIHNKNLSRAEAMKLMTKGAFQEQAEAEGKWHRATVSQVQLTSYFAGFAEIYSLREEMKEKKGDRFNLKEFHETFLSFGSSPIREIRKLM